MGFLLSIVSVVLTLVLLPLGFTYSFIRLMIGNNTNVWFNKFNSLFMQVAISVDQLGNTFYKYLFDDLFIYNTSKNKFGDVDETISSVLGKNKRDKTLTTIGLLICFILDSLDENHCIKSIDK